MKVTQTRKWKKLIIACVLLGFTAVPFANAIADDDKGNHKRQHLAVAVSPNDLVAGMSYGDWGAAWWQWAVSIPIEDNPLSGSEGTDCSEGQGSSPVFFIGGTFGDEDEVVENEEDNIINITRECVMPVGSYLFFPIINGIEHNADPDEEIDVEVEAAQRESIAWLISNLVDVDSLEVTVDGKKVKGAKNLSDFRAQSPNLPFTLPENSVISENSGRFHGTADGYWMMLEPLSPGEYDLKVKGNVVVGDVIVFGLDITYYLSVE